jgi:lysophospholipase L1-like esterase
MRFLLVGDSRTIGCAGDATWRQRLWRHLDDSPAMGPFSFVGPRSGQYDPGTGTVVPAGPGLHPAARRHLAGWGEGWLHMAPLIRETVAEHRPDVLLVWLGLIDLGFYTNAEQTAVNVRRFVEEARAADPGIRMAVMPVIPNVRARNDRLFAAECARFGELLAGVVDELGGSGSSVVLAAPPDPYDLDTDTRDGTHPAPSGERRLAAAFAETLYRTWGIGAPRPYGGPGPDGDPGPRS